VFQHRTHRSQHHVGVCCVVNITCAQSYTLHYCQLYGTAESFIVIPTWRRFSSISKWVRGNNFVE
jgi:hypothetical protein